MHPIGAVHNIDFRPLVEKHELLQGETLVETFDLVLKYPPYNVFRVRQDTSSVHYRLSTNYLVGVANFWKAVMIVMRLGTDDHILCYAIQFGPWCKALVKESESIETSIMVKKIPLDTKENWEFCLCSIWNRSLFIIPEQ